MFSYWFMVTNIIHHSSGMSVNVRFCPEMSGYIRQSFILLVCFRWRRYHICTPLVKFFKDYFWGIYRKNSLMYSKWSLCFLVANIQFWKCEVKCFGKFFMKDVEYFLSLFIYKWLSIDYQIHLKSSYLSFQFVWRR